MRGIITATANLGLLIGILVAIIIFTHKRLPAGGRW